MKSQLIPDIPILDTDVYSPYRSAIVNACTRISTGLYLVVTSWLDSIYVDKLYLVGQKITYKLKKSVLDGQCKTTIEK